MYIIQCIILIRFRFCNVAFIKLNVITKLGLMNFYYIYIIHLFDIAISDMMYFLDVKLKQISLRPLSL